MTPGLLGALVDLAHDQPRLAGEIKALALLDGTTDEQWEDGAHLGAMKRVTPVVTALDEDAPPENPNPALYMTVRGESPTALVLGDRVYVSPNATLFWVVPHNDSRVSPQMPIGFRYLGTFDGQSIVGAS